MCSIAGIVNFQNPAEAEQVVGAMNRRQAHRGPDGDGIWHDRTAMLGHRRLSIIDLAGGAQPMTNEDGSLHLVFNGEIYNYRVLRHLLEQKGHVFHSHCDTEVILHLYEEYGARLAAHLAGMFAFALWDARNQLLLLGRDRLGQKPLVYFRRAKELVFASELEALKQHPGFPRELAPDAVASYLSLLYIPHDRTVYQGVVKLPPGHTLLYEAATGTGTLERYWHPKFDEKAECSFEEAVKFVRQKVTGAVEKRLMADVPAGSFLSGGLDSAIVTGVMAKLRSERGERTSAFTIGFEDPAYDERPLARLAAQRINAMTGGKLDHYEKVVDSSDFHLVEKLLPHFGEPFADASMLPTFLLSEFTHEHVGMALSGDGADEVFGGYERYLVMKYAGAFDLLPDLFRNRFFRFCARTINDSGERTTAGRMRRLCNVIARRPKSRYFAILDRCPPELKRSLFGERLYDQLSCDSGRSLHAVDLTAKNPAERCMELDLYTYLPGDTLVKADIASMAASLEVRSPFLDHEVIELASLLPLSYKIRGQSRKHVLKAAFADIVPPEILAGRKRGFGVPVASWLRSCWKTSAQEALFCGRLATDGWIEEPVLLSLWDEHQSGLRDHSYILWELVVFSLFLNKQ